MASSDKTPRNAPCPCGSGKKYKFCCLKKHRQAPKAFEDSFVLLPPTKEVFYLDTCVWALLTQSEETRNNFCSYFHSNDHVAALSGFALFELSRAPRTFTHRDSLFRDMKYNIWIPCLYDQVLESELHSYPNTWTMRWLPVSVFVDEKNPNFLSTLASDPGVSHTRDAHLQFGHDHFMRLEQFKQNFPPQNGEEYTPDDADHFAWCNTVDFLRRHFREFLRPFRNDASKLKAESLLSLRIRSLFLFYKYYIHGQSPGESDFMDFAHVSYAPYCSTFVTERNACNVLTRIRNSGLMLSDTRVLHISDFLKEIHPR